jgi:hypothetical protein
MLALRQRVEGDILHRGDYIRGTELHVPCFDHLAFQRRTLLPGTNRQFVDAPFAIVRRIFKPRFPARRRRKPAVVILYVRTRLHNGEKPKLIKILLQARSF